MRRLSTVEIKHSSRPDITARMAELSSRQECEEPTALARMMKAMKD